MKIIKIICMMIFENDEGIFKIEISETSDLLDKKNIYDSLSTGSIYIKSWPVKTLAYYTQNPSIRTYNKRSNDMFVFRCDTFPDCSYTYE